MGVCMAKRVDTEDNALDFELIRSVGDYFQLTPAEMEGILARIKRSTQRWPTIAKDIGIPRIEQELMEGAFLFAS